MQRRNHFALDPWRGEGKGSVEDFAFIGHTEVKDEYLKYINEDIELNDVNKYYYSIKEDLENKEMHWWKFMDLMNGLSNSELGNCCVLNNIRNLHQLIND